MTNPIADLISNLPFLSRRATADAEPLAKENLTPSQSLKSDLFNKLNGSNFSDFSEVGRTTFIAITTLLHERDSLSKDELSLALKDMTDSDINSAISFGLYVITGHDSIEELNQESSSISNDFVKAHFQEPINIFFEKAKASHEKSPFVIFQNQLSYFFSDLNTIGIENASLGQLIVAKNLHDLMTHYNENNDFKMQLRTDEEWIKFGDAISEALK